MCVLVLGASVCRYQDSHVAIIPTRFVHVELVCYISFFGRDLECGRGEGEGEGEGEADGCMM